MYELEVRNSKGATIDASTIAFDSSILNDDMQLHEEYDPFAARGPGQRNTDFAVFMHLLKASIGSGILFLPHAFRRAGYASALVCSVVIGVISCHTAVLTVQCSQILCKRMRRSTLNFAETAGASFEVGPKWIRKYAVAFCVITNALVCFVQYETTIIYALYVATSSQQVIEHLTGLSIDVRVCLVIFLPIYWSLAMIPDLKHLVPLSVTGAILLGLGFIASLYYLMIDFPDPGRLDFNTGILSVPIYCSIFLFAVHNMSVLMPLENTMKNPQRMPIILVISMTVNVFIYMAFGFLGYNKYNEACDTVIKNLPLDEPLAQFIKIAITLSVVATYGLQYLVPVTIIWPMVAQKMPESHWNFEILFRLGGVTLSTGIAIAIPKLAPLLGLFSALSITTVMLLIPVVIEIATKWYDRRNRIYFYTRLFKDAIILVLWLLLLVFGISENVRDIARSFAHSAFQSDDEICQ